MLGTLVYPSILCVCIFWAVFVNVCTSTEIEVWVACHVACRQRFKWSIRTALWVSQCLCLLVANAAFSHSSQRHKRSPTSFRNYRTRIKALTMSLSTPRVMCQHLILCSSSATIDSVLIFTIVCNNWPFLAARPLSIRTPHVFMTVYSVLAFCNWQSYLWWLSCHACHCMRLHGKLLDPTKHRHTQQCTRQIY